MVEPQGAASGAEAHNLIVAGVGRRRKGAARIVDCRQRGEVLEDAVRHGD